MRRRGGRERGGRGFLFLDADFFSIGGFTKVYFMQDPSQLSYNLPGPGLPGHVLPGPVLPGPGFLDHDLLDLDFLDLDFVDLDFLDLDFLHLDGRCGRERREIPISS